MRRNSSKALPPGPADEDSASPFLARFSSLAMVPLRAFSSSSLFSMRSISRFMVSTMPRCSARCASARSRSAMMRFLCFSASRASCSSSDWSASSARRSHLSTSRSSSSTFRPSRFCVPSVSTISFLAALTDSDISVMVSSSDFSGSSALSSSELMLLEMTRPIRSKIPMALSNMRSSAALRRLPRLARPQAPNTPRPKAPAGGWPAPGCPCSPPCFARPPKSP